jgi:hypothetical protein
MNVSLATAMATRTSATMMRRWTVRACHWTSTATWRVAVCAKSANISRMASTVRHASLDTSDLKEFLLTPLSHAFVSVLLLFTPIFLICYLCHGGEFAFLWTLDVT